MSTSRRPHPLVALAALLLLAVVIPALAGPTAADAASKRCKARPGTVYKDGATRVFHAGSSLYACTRLTPRGFARTVRLGPWSRGSRAVSNGSYVAWARRWRMDDERFDNIWAASIDGRRFLVDSPAIPASGGGAVDIDTVQRLLVADYGAGWVTNAGHVGLAIGAPTSTAPVAIGTPPSPLTADGRRVLVGSFPGVPAAQLAATARLSAETGETDDCGGSMTHTLTVQPPGAPEPVGVRWTGGAPISPEICNL